MRPSDGIKWFSEVALGPALAEAFQIVSLQVLTALCTQHPEELALPQGWSRFKGTCLRLYGKADGGARVETMGEGQEPTMLSLARVRQTNET